METDSLINSRSREGENGRIKWYTVDKHMIPAKISYYFSNARYAITDYFVLFYVSAGLSPHEAGLINGLQYLGGMIGSPLWGLLSDKKGHHRTITIFLCAMAIISICIQPCLTAKFSDSRLNHCPARLNQSHEANLSDPVYDKKNILFYSLLLVSIFTASFDGSIMAFIDAGVLQRLKTSTRNANIGMQRTIASLGTSSGSIAYTLSINYFPKGDLSCFVGIFINYSVLAVCTALASHFLFKGIAVKKERKESVMKLLRKALNKFDTVFFLLTVLFNGIVQALMFSFLFLYLKELNAPTLLFGFSISLNSVSAVIIYSISNKLIISVGGSMNAMCLSCFAWAIRLLCTAYLTTPYAIFAIDIFHGFTYSLFRAASLQYVKETNDPSIFSSMCGIVNSLYLSFAFLIANVFGGNLYERFGPKKLFVGTSVACVVWTLCMLCYILVKRYRKKRYCKGNMETALISSE